MSKYENIKMLEFVKRSFNDHLSQVLYKSTELTQVFGNITLTTVKKNQTLIELKSDNLQHNTLGCWDKQLLDQVLSFF